jgi:hypothetical protein
LRKFSHFRICTWVRNGNVHHTHTHARTHTRAHTHTHTHAPASANSQLTPVRSQRSLFLPDTLLFNNLLIMYPPASSLRPLVIAVSLKSLWFDSSAVHVRWVIGSVVQVFLWVVIVPLILHNHSTIIQGCTIHPSIASV